MSCTSCHSVHVAKTDANLLQADQPQLCYGCHTDVKPAFAQPFHHRAGFISYTRSAPTRAIFPTEVVHFQSSSIHNVPFNGDVRYTAANTDLPEFNEYFNGIDRATRFEQFTGHSHTKRIDVGADLGVLWQATETVRFAEQFDYSDFRQPGYASLATQTWVTATGPAAESMLNNSVTTTGVGKPTVRRTYLGQRVGTNNLSATWDVPARASLSLTYRYRSRNISNTNMAGTINATTGVVFTTIHENGGVLNFTLRPTSQWQLNGSVEAIYADNAYTPVSPREAQHYRLHTKYKPRPWATVSGVFNDLERRNNQNSGVIVNNPLLAGAGTTFTGGSLALNHVDDSGGGSVAVSLAPTEHYGFDFSYTYTDIYTSTNICYNTGQTSSLYGGPASFPAVVTNTPCPINIGGQQSAGKQYQSGRCHQGLHGCAQSIRISCSGTFAKQASALFHRISLEFCQRESNLSQSPQCEWIA